MSDDLARDDHGRFAVGNAGGPGRPRSAVSRGAVELDEIGADMGKQLLQVMMDKAMAGDTEAAKLLLSRIWPARRGRPVEIESTPIKAVPDYVSAATDVTNAVMRGEMTPHEGHAVSSMLELQVKTIDMAVVMRKIDELEEKFAEQKSETSRFATEYARFLEGPEDEKA
jgi:hypothetical protein